MSSLLTLQYYIQTILSNKTMNKLNWSTLLSEEKKLPYFQKIFSILLKKRKQGIIIYPKKEDIFNAFRFTSFSSVKVVIIGQDPYYGPNQAHGLAFSVPFGTIIPPSLHNIHKELSSDISNFIKPKHGCLKSWSKEGVLLLNSILTVEQGKSRSHSNIGWERFTNKVIEVLNHHQRNIIFLLWGAYAQKKGNIINHKKHYILETSHPSPISAHHGFLGCRHFSKTNILLTQNNQSTINWQLEYIK